MQRKAFEATVAWLCADFGWFLSGLKSVAECSSPPADNKAAAHSISC